MKNSEKLLIMFEVPLDKRMNTAILDSYNKMKFCWAFCEPTSHETKCQDWIKTGNGQWFCKNVKK